MKFGSAAVVLVFEDEGAGSVAEGASDSSEEELVEVVAAVGVYDLADLRGRHLEVLELPPFDVGVEELRGDSDAAAAEPVGPDEFFEVVLQFVHGRIVDVRVGFPSKSHTFAAGGLGVRPMAPASSYPIYPRVKEVSVSTAPTGSAEADAITAELRAQAEAGYPDTLRLEAGQEVTGTVVRYESAYTQRSELAHIMVIESLATKKLWSVWLLHTTLRNEVMTSKPRPGEIVYLKYDGLIEPKTPGGSSYHSWTLIVKRDVNNPGTMPWEVPGVQADPRTAAQAMTTPTFDEGVPTPSPDTSVATGATVPAGHEGTPVPADDIPF